MHKLKQFVFLCMAALAGWFLMFGPRPGRTLPQNCVIVEYWEKWVGVEGAQMQEIVDDFNRTVGRQKHIFVRYLPISSIDEKVMIATAAGVPPDIAGQWDAETVQFAHLGAYLPLDDLAKAHGITADTYLPIYWDACHYQGHLWTLVSTPAAVALHYNKKIFRDNAAALRQAGCDPDRPPQTIEELDRYAAALDVTDSAGHIERFGYLPMEPGWYVHFTPYWFGGELFDEKRQRFTFDLPQNIAAYTWIQSYSKRLGREAMVESHDASQAWDTPQNPFLTGSLVMEQQGPWMANYIYNLLHKTPWAPSMSEALVPRQREWSLKDRRDNYDWAAAPFPSAVPGLKDVTVAPFDTFAIPAGARHPHEAFEFMAYVTQQRVMEKLCSLQCKSSPLRKVSRAFLAHHPNPYIDVFDQLAASPNAHGCPKCPLWPEASKELRDAAQAVAMLDKEPQQALEEAQQRIEAKWERQQAIDRAREQRGD